MRLSFLLVVVTVSYHVRCQLELVKIPTASEFLKSMGFSVEVQKILEGSLYNSFLVENPTKIIENKPARITRPDYKPTSKTWTYVKQNKSRTPISPQEIGRYLNQARTNPRSLIPHIKAQLAKFGRNNQMDLGPTAYYQTNEGRAAWIEAIAYLEKQQPMHPLTFHEGLSKSSMHHANDLALHNMMGHIGSDGSRLSDRVSMFCNWSVGKIGENVALIFTQPGQNNALETIVGLIIDDGVPDRGHRKSIFDRDFSYFGTASTWSNRHLLTVINLSSSNLPQKGVQPPRLYYPYRSRVISINNRQNSIPSTRPSIIYGGVRVPRYITIQRSSSPSRR